MAAADWQLAGGRTDGEEKERMDGMELVAGPVATWNFGAR